MRSALLDDIRKIEGLTGRVVADGTRTLAHLLLSRAPSPQLSMPDLINFPDRYKVFLGSSFGRLIRQLVSLPSVKPFAAATAQIPYAEQQQQHSQLMLTNGGGDQADVGGRTTRSQLMLLQGKLQQHEATGMNVTLTGPEDLISIELGDDMVDVAFRASPATLACARDFAFCISMLGDVCTLLPDLQRMADKGGRLLTMGAARESTLMTLGLVDSITEKLGGHLAHITQISHSKMETLKRRRGDPMKNLWLKHHIKEQAGYNSFTLTCQTLRFSTGSLIERTKEYDVQAEMLQANQHVAFVRMRVSAIARAACPHFNVDMPAFVMQEQQALAAPVTLPANVPPPHVATAPQPSRSGGEAELLQILAAPTQSGTEAELLQILAAAKPRTPPGTPGIGQSPVSGNPFDKPPAPASSNPFPPDSSAAPVASNPFPPDQSRAPTDSSPTADGAFAAAFDDAAAAGGDGGSMFSPPSWRPAGHPSSPSRTSSTPSATSPPLSPSARSAFQPTADTLTSPWPASSSLPSTPATASATPASDANTQFPSPPLLAATSGPAADDAVVIPKVVLMIGQRKYKRVELRVSKSSPQASFTEAFESLQPGALVDYFDDDINEWVVLDQHFCDNVSAGLRERPGLVARIRARDGVPPSFATPPPPECDTPAAAMASAARIELERSGQIAAEAQRLLGGDHPPVAVEAPPGGSVAADERSTAADELVDAFDPDAINLGAAMFRSSPKKKPKSPGAFSRALRSSRKSRGSLSPVPTCAPEHSTDEPEPALAPPSRTRTESSIERFVVKEQADKVGSMTNAAHRLIEESAAMPAVVHRFGETFRVDRTKVLASVSRAISGFSENQRRYSWQNPPIFRAVLEDRMTELRNLGINMNDGSVAEWNALLVTLDATIRIEFQLGATPAEPNAPLPSSDAVDSTEEGSSPSPEDGDGSDVPFSVKTKNLLLDKAGMSVSSVAGLKSGNYTDYIRSELRDTIERFLAVETSAMQTLLRGRTCLRLRQHTRAFLWVNTTYRYRASIQKLLIGNDDDVGCEVGHTGSSGNRLLRAILAVELEAIDGLLQQLQEELGFVEVEAAHKKAASATDALAEQLAPYLTALRAAGKAQAGVTDAEEEEDDEDTRSVRRLGAFESAEHAAEALIASNLQRLMGNQANVERQIKAANSRSKKEKLTTELYSMILSCNQDFERTCNGTTNFHLLLHFLSSAMSPPKSRARRPWRSYGCGTTDPHLPLRYRPLLALALALTLT